MEAALLAQAVGERGVARPGHEQTHTVVARAVLEGQNIMELHDVLMAQGSEHVPPPRGGDRCAPETVPP